MLVWGPNTYVPKYLRRVESTFICVYCPVDVIESGELRVQEMQGILNVAGVDFAHFLPATAECEILRRNRARKWQGISGGE